MYFNRDYLFDILGFAVQCGADEKSFAQLRKFANQGAEGQTTYELIDQSFQLAVQETRDEHFGLHLGEHAVIKATENVDQIMQWSMNLEEAFSNAVHYSKLISDSMSCALNRGQNEFGISFHYNPDWALRSELAKRHNLDSALVSALKSFPMLTGNRYYPNRVMLPYNKPRKFNEYYRVFNCSLSFNQSHAEIIFANKLLDENVRSADSGLLQKSRLAAAESIRALAGDDGLIIAVKKAILGDVDGTIFPTLAKVARGMNSTERTLQRNLKAKGTSYHHLLLDIKMKLAVRHLKEEGMSVAETAYLTGYSESSALIRAFKQWYGKTPRSFRD